jgi:hypothetical protein
MKKRDILIAIIVIVFGITYNAVRSGDIRFYSGCSVDSRELLDRKYPVTFPQKELQYDVGNVKKLIINNPAGDIEVARSTDGSFRVKTVITVYQKNKKQAGLIAQSVRVTSRIEAGNIAMIGIEHDKRDFYRRVRVQFKCLIPENLQLNITNRFGNVDVNDAGRDVTIDQRYGSLFLKNIDSPISVTSHDGRVRLYEITGHVQLHSNQSRVKIRNVHSIDARCLHANIFINDVKEETVFSSLGYSRIEIESAGRVNIEGKQTRVKLKGIKNGVEIKNSHAPIYLENINGNVNIDAKDCRLGISHAASDLIIIKDSYSYVDLENVSGRNVEVEMNNGELRMLFNNIEETLKIDTRETDVTLNYPESVKPAFHINLTNGNIINRTSVQLPVEEEREKHYLTTEDGKPVITIDSRYGDVLLKHTAAVPAEKPIEEPQIPPVTAEKVE